MNASTLAVQALAGLRSGVMVFDRDGRLRLVNAAAEQILAGRLPRPATPGGDLEGVLAAAPELIEPLRRALAGEPPPERSEVVLAPRAEVPTPLTVGFTASVLRDEASGVDGAMLLFRDLVAIERRGERERVRERLAVLGAVAAQLAHELRNPVAAMTVQTSLLRRRVDSPEARGFLDAIERELAAVERSVARTLETVAPRVVERRICDVAKLLEAALARACARVPFCGRVERVYADSLPPLYADADRLEAAFAHLIENALEAMADQPAGRLRLTLRQRDAREQASTPSGCERIGSELELEIEDDGPGIPESLRERIFHPFVTTKPEGAGIGLAAAHEVVTRHGGSLCVVPEELRRTAAPRGRRSEGPGATFRVLLPIGEGES